MSNNFRTKKIISLLVFLSVLLFPDNRDDFLKILIRNYPDNIADCGVYLTCEGKKLTITTKKGIMATVIFDPFMRKMLNDEKCFSEEFLWRLNFMHDML